MFIQPSRLYRYGTPHSTGTGKGVTIYTLDSGLRITHQEFQAWDGSGRRGNYGCVCLAAFQGIDIDILSHLTALGRDKRARMLKEEVWNANGKDM